jgi:hypothetical protein
MLYIIQRMNPEKSPKSELYEICDYTPSNKTDYNKHLFTGNSINTTKYNILQHENPQSTPKFICEMCNYETGNKKDFNKHLLTDKHINRTAIPNSLENISKKEHICNCGKKYNHRASLFNHRKKCISNIENKTLLDASSNEIKTLETLVVDLVKSNNDLQKQVLEICQKIQQPTINTNSHNNNNNKTFNLHFFLNEECKDAMNMSEFIDSIKLKISDLENIGKLGYIEGMSNIIIKQLNDTDINKRPVHCSDAKRETLYIKDENKWEKDTEETKKMVKAVRDVDKKNYQLLSNWKEIYPECANSKSKQSDEYLKVVNKVMDGDEENVNKVIKKVSKQVLIDK